MRNGTNIMNGQQKYVKASRPLCTKELNLSTSTHINHYREAARYCHVIE
jgi:hypothetical protein